MVMGKFTVKLNVENIGPHYGDKKLDFSDVFESNKAVFFATNGTGKSFISRAFRLSTADKRNKLTDDLITLGQTSGNLTFSIIDQEKVKEISISIERGKSPTIRDNTDLLFHIFNSDYVEDNIKPRNYTPDGHIEGYILGKTQIDLTEERGRERILEAECELSKKVIDSEIEEAKNQLRNQGILSTITEFKLLEIQHLRESEQHYDVSSYEEIATQLDTLSSAPEELTDIQAPLSIISSPDFNEVIAILTTKYPQTEWDKEFVSEVKDNRVFIEHGVEKLNEGSRCPFCKQFLEVEALDLINNYKLFLADKEAEALRKIETCMDQIKTNIDYLKNTSLSIRAANIEIVALSRYFPSLKKFKLEAPIIDDDYLSEFLSIIKLLEEKTTEISSVSPNISSLVDSCKNRNEDINRIITENLQIINEVNKIKQDSTRERRALRRDLCKAQYLRLREKMTHLFTDYEIKTKNLQDLRESIRDKEQTMKVSRRDRVFNTLAQLLNLFFDKKYCIDESTFQIRFLGNTIGSEISRILSDGEKSIVAFCFFLASTHLLIEKEDDYSKLFFIIDDPVSSMDFHYVYAVAQTLRSINDFFGVSSYARIWVLTHNTEFLSIIVRNHIIEKTYIISPGRIELLNHKLLMPYENHLKDIVDIAYGRQQPSHTTANSIRHILETVSHFEFPNMAIMQYIMKHDSLAKDSCIYSLCQDLSHGGIRNQQPISTQILKTACDVVVIFMKKKYPGQVESILAQNK